MPILQSDVGVESVGAADELVHSLVSNRPAQRLPTLVHKRSVKTQITPRCDCNPLSSNHRRRVFGTKLCARDALQSSATLLTGMVGTATGVGIDSGMPFFADCTHCDTPPSAGHCSQYKQYTNHASKR